MKKQEEKKITIEKVSKKESRRRDAINNKKFNCLVTGIFVSLVIIILTIFTIKPIFKNLNYGLDLKGGFEILYEVDSIDGSKVTNEMVKNTYSIIEKRINILGVSEPEISIEGNNIRVQLAGVTDENQAKSTLTQMANLTFRNSKDELVMTSDVLKSGSVTAMQDPNNIGTWYLSIEIKDVDTFHEQTEKIRKSNDVLVIWLDFDEATDNFEKELAQGSCGTGSNSRCISYANIKDELTTDKVQLTGNFKEAEAKNLAELINSGSLPTKLNELSSQTVDATFGNDALDKTFIAGLIGIAVIMLILIACYRFSGLITSISVLVYTMLVFVIFELIGGRLTLPGIAAVVIGIGMAVDASSISFASIKSELRNKRSVKEAFKNGNKTSFTAILDSNITTLIAAVVLYIFGVSSVKGFATMLIISIFVTIIVMVFFNRYLLSQFVESGLFDNHEKLFIGHVSEKTPKFKFIKNRLFTLIIIPLVIFLVGALSLFKQGLNLGIDFKGGTTITLTSADKITKTDIEKDIESLGYKVTNVNSIDEYTVIINSSDIFKADDNKKVDTYFNSKYKESSTSIGSISNTVKKELIKNAFKSLLFACICILIYISLKFKFTNAISTITALLHDCLIVIVVFSLCKFEITSVFIAAILSIIGYSINDTIVIFDRIKDAIKNRGKQEIKSEEELASVIDDALNDTLGRCIITSITTLVPVISLIIFGAHDILNFNIALLVGLLAGTYSSLLIAPSLYYIIEKRKIGKPKKKKWYEDDEKEVSELKVKGINC